MTNKSSAPAADPTSPLVTEVQRILSDALGLRARFSPVPEAWGPPVVALGVLAVYALAWLAVEAYAGHAGWHREPRLVSLIAWGGVYFAAVHYFAQSATARVLETIKLDIEPYASQAYVDRVTGHLADRFNAWHAVGFPFIVAALWLVAAIFAVDADLSSSPGYGGPLSPEFLFWAATFFIFLFTGSQAVVSARFYLSFAENLAMEARSFYVLGAAESPLVVGLARLGNQVMVFWLLIFLAIVSSMLLASEGLGDYGFPAQAWFLLVLVPLAGFLSLGFGSMVYLDSEAKIRATLRRFIQEKLAPVRRRTADLFVDWKDDCPERREILAELAELHDRAVAGSRYGSRMTAGLSLALPLILPIVSLIKLVID